MSQEEPIKIIIVGGAAGGMSSALRARRLSEKASIILIEKHNYTSYANSGMPSSVGGVIETDTFLIHQSPAGLKDRFDLDVRDCTEITSIWKEQHKILVRRVDTNDSYILPYDKLILAQGASFAIPQIQGIESENVFSLQMMLDLQRIKDYTAKNHCRSAAILGGGYFALKAVESLSYFGLRLSIIHTEGRMCQDFDPDFANIVQTELIRHEVQVHLNANILNIGAGVLEDGCIVTLANESNISADIVIIATSLTPRKDIAESSGLLCNNGVIVNEFMQTSDPDIYAVGALAETSNYLLAALQIQHTLPLNSPARQQGRLASDHIMKRAVPYRGRIVTYSCKCFKLTVAITGFSGEKLREIGYFPNAVTAQIPEHAGYYPASQQTTLRVAFQPASGRLLGAQIIGRSAIDKSIDVLSTALQFGRSVFDLENLELSYAPQYGSAKDPVNVIGMIGSDLLHGDLHIISPKELESHFEEVQILDVRSAEDFAKGHIPSARNYPLDMLRKSLADIDKRCAIVVYSRVGYHGYLAYRTLVQSGYQAANLDGGLKLLVEGGSGIKLVSSGSD
ncbi:hypothetical protein N7520_002314 [Penicillium odoratum]|uniref:uncharacterized protein n=1 Tax=Penicillium odoratum TaxID=1167516 RepID=UPI00254719D7|nr:uncharacterized protein N7520_002314 [Penicillium odoratum]KAJ5771785.1 hypothetical protein N7520_002314 [Penicillium odoratum]